jgi:hypothetical protein
LSYLIVVVVLIFELEPRLLDPEDGGGPWLDSQPACARDSIHANMQSVAPMKRPRDEGSIIRPVEHAESFGLDLCLDQARRLRDRM